MYSYPSWRILFQEEVIKWTHLIISQCFVTHCTPRLSTCSQNSWRWRACLCALHSYTTLFWSTSCAILICFPGREPWFCLICLGSINNFLSHVPFRLQASVLVSETLSSVGSWRIAPQEGLKETVRCEGVFLIGTLACRLSTVFLIPSFSSAYLMSFTLNSPVC